MRAEIVSIGDELLTGQKINTNAAFLCSELGAAGIGVQRVVACADREDAIAGQLAESLGRCELVVATGGLGPTRDDMTRTSVSELLGRDLVFDREVYDATLQRYARRGKPPASNLRDNAMVIRGSVVIPNVVGMAPGMIISCPEPFGGRYLVVMPGVPSEMKAMMHNTVLPYFAEKSGAVIVHTHIRTTGIGESSLAAIVGDIEDRLPDGTALAYLPHEAGVHLRVSSSGRNRSAVERDNRDIAAAVASVAEEYVYAMEDVSLEEVVGRQLLSRGLTISTAESCTGGLVSSRLTDVAGSSGYFGEGYVVYSNRSKVENLGVNPRIIEDFGAVSEETAGEMARGCLLKSGADIAVSTTGIAGPAGGSAAKPAGLVCLGLARKDANGTVSVRTVTFRTLGDRLRNKLRFSEAALRMVWRELSITRPISS
ncbi:competence/damage-inducible protein A [Prosthecochloris sp. GSB1]|uniref:competence/damage-inducible protein A n=1 Tax=Prosthecochloris sp. GSB1 TaxID=281093 RepID=UPI000B8CAEDB|nr:competence/damage-inducible protein A [Prosthecochloris sp. GSB1]ASQ89743.1 competence/damage-inducible protein A [Prosthecochloris sp. GSB1]